MIKADDLKQLLCLTPDSIFVDQEYTLYLADLSVSGRPETDDGNFSSHHVKCVSKEVVKVDREAFDLRLKFLNLENNCNVFLYSVMNGITWYIRNKTI
jgi:hypothetical protein